MSGIRIVNDEQANRTPAGSAAAANMLLWVGLLGLIWGLVGWVNVVALGVGVVFCVLAWLQSKKIGKKVCPGCRAAIEWEATACPSCQRDVE